MNKQKLEEVLQALLISKQQAYDQYQQYIGAVALVQKLIAELPKAETSMVKE